MKKVALITGITGQDGSYLAELLIEQGYEVHGIIRRSSSFNTGRIDHLHTDREGSKTQIYTHYADLGDSSSLHRIIQKIRPTEIYNLGAQSHVKVSFDVPEYSGDVNGLGAVRILEAIREIDPSIKFYQASSSELYGKVLETPQSETTPFNPRSPYACSKAYAFYITKNYRESYNMFAVNGILFNHESERRGRNFVTRKISRNMAEIKLGKRDTMYLGNLEALRDWGYSKDYVRAMWMMMQHDIPDDYVVATGEMHSVREFVEAAAKALEINLEWRGEGLDEVGVDVDTGKVIVAIDERYFRPAEVDLLLGDASKAKTVLGWEPQVRFEELVKIMVQSDVTMIENHDERY